MAKRKVCAIPLCPAFRKKGSYVCAAHATEQKAAKAHKYGAVSTTVDGIRFDSKAEAKRWGELQLLAKAGQIRNLTRQPEFALHAAPLTRTDLPTTLGPSDVLPLLVGVARMDFQYLQGPMWHMVVEDVKGLDNALSRWKRKHLTLEYGIDVVIVR